VSCDSPDRVRDSRRRIALALVLTGAYAIPLFVPPPPVLPAVAGPEWSWLERLFPGVPPAWVALRLCALALAAGLVASTVRTSVGRLTSVPGSPPPVVPKAALAAALGVAAVHALLTVAGPDPGRGAQALHLVALFVPALLVGLASSRTSALAAKRAALARLVPVAAVVGVWVLIGVLAVHGSVRPADVVDTWSGFDALVRAASDSRNLLRESDLAGVPGTYLFLQGVAWMGPDRLEPGLAAIQAIHFFWLAVAGIAVGWLAARLVAPGTAAVATAALLFSPFVLMIPYQTAPFFLGIVMTSGLLVAALGVHVRRSPAALIALGALVGIATAMPPVWPMAACVGLAAIVSLTRTPRLPAVAVAVAALCALTGALPGLPDAQDLAAMSAAYTEARGSWAGLELLVMGQLPVNSPILWQMGAPAWFDIPLGSLLAPFAIPRTPLRLWGDALFDPVAASLAAFGLAACLRHGRRHPASLLLPILLAVGLAPGFVSSFDRPSHTRLFTAPVPLALLSAVGFEALRRGLWPRSGSTAAGSASGVVVAALLIALSGSVLFHRVTPPLLAQSSLGIALRALGDRPPEGGAVVLAHPPPKDTHWLYVQEIASQVPDRPLGVVPWGGSAALLAPDGTPRAELFLWSPGLEADEHVMRAVCARWPAAALYRLSDPVGVSSTWAVRPAGAGWTPALPPHQWHESGCP